MARIAPKNNADSSKTHMMWRILWLIAIAAVIAPGLGGSAARAVAQGQSSDDLDVVQLRPNFYVIAGAGGNIVVQLGPVGVILVDSGSAQMSDKVLATI